MLTDVGLTVVFFDGVCGLCDRFVSFLLARDADSRLRFAPLQGDLARRELEPLGHDPSQLDSVFVIADWQGPQQRVLTRSHAILHAVSRLGGVWSLAARTGLLVPSAIADPIYGFVARRRYRLFGTFETCPLPRPEWRQRFLE
jgi:predicted DCC family thiol-disulfide oxidoreductase YuxK